MTYLRVRVSGGVLSVGLALAAAVLLGGCAPRPGGVEETVASTRLKQGRVMGGQQPVSGATIQLYAVGATGDGSAATPLLTQVVTTDANGGFSIAGDYTCPSPSTLVYLVATGGNPGMTAGTNNAALALMGAIGPCWTLTSSTALSINELTTVAAVWTLAPFMNSYSAIGSGTGDAASLTNAFTVAAEFANLTTGTVPGANVPAGVTVPVAQIDTIADILTSCINTAGGMSGDGSPCGNLFRYSTPAGGTAATNVIGAGINIANNPALNVANLFAMVAGTAPFQPTLGAPPVDYAVRLLPAVGVAALSISVDSMSFPAGVVALASSPSTITITNSGNVAVALNGIAVVGVDAADFVQSNACPSSLVAAASCNVQVTFTPMATGARSSALVVTSSAPGSPQLVALEGAGSAGSIAAGSAVLSAASLGFYPLTSLQEVYPDVSVQTVTLSNFGSTPLTIAAIRLSSADWTERDNCGASLEAQSVCIIALRATSNVATGTLTVVDNDTADVQVIQLTNDFLTPNSINDFGFLPPGYPGPARTLYISGGIDTGTSVGPQEIYEFNLTGVSGPDSSSFEFNNENGIDRPSCSIKTYTNCNILVTFPGGPVGPNVLYAFDILGNTTLQEGYQMAAVDSFAFSPVAIDIGPQAVGTARNGVATVVNHSVVPAGITVRTVALSSGPSNNGDFSIASDGCSGTNLPLANALQNAPTYGPFWVYGLNNCSIYISFRPSVFGARSTVLTVTDITGFSQQALITGQGVYASPVLSQSQFEFGSVAVGTTSGSQTVSVTLPNLDAATAQIVGSSSPYHLSGTATCAQGATTCSFAAVFSPTTPGETGGVLQVTDTATGYTATLTLDGTGGGPAVFLSTMGLTFAPHSVGVMSTPQTMTFTNTGNLPLALASIGVVGPNASDFIISSTTCNSTVAVGATCSLGISFTAGGVGTRGASLQVVSNAPSSPDLVQLSGTGN